MPYLIDGNNLMHAIASEGLDADRRALCDILSEVIDPGERAIVFLDGPKRRWEPPENPETSRLEVRFSGKRPADDLLIEEIAASSAPKRLTVVSTDLEVRAAARRRRCRIVTSEAFARDLRRRWHAPSDELNPRPEPKEKKHGLTEKQTRHWLREFGLDVGGKESSGGDPRQ